MVTVGWGSDEKINQIKNDPTIAGLLALNDQTIAVCVGFFVNRCGTGFSLIVPFSRNRVC
jgi:hypothetical protein